MTEIAVPQPIRTIPGGLSKDPCFEPVVRLPLPAPRDRIRVVELLATGTSGGAQEHVFNIVSRLDRSRYDVSVLALGNGAAIRRLERAHIDVCVLEDMDDAEAIEAVAAHLIAVKADVVHNHMYRAEVVGTQAAWAVAAAGKPRPYIVGTVHSSRIRSDEDRELLRQLTPRMDHLIAVSTAIEHKLEEEGRVGAPISLIYNGVDLTRYSEPDICGTLHSEYPISPDSPIVGVVARLEPEKGHPTLLEAWPAVIAAVPKAHLLIVGEGSQRELLEAQARSLGLVVSDSSPVASSVGASSPAASSPAASTPLASSRAVMQQLASNSAAGARRPSVTFTGRRDDVPAVTAALDVAVLPSYREAQGLSILEAMALSRPVVASAVGGIPEMIEHGRTGLLVPPRDPEALAAAIVRLLKDHPYADTLAKAAQNLVHDRFCVELMVRAIETIYDESVSEDRRLAAG
jgi:glycosyltransferase involved in cell wall biosynthesis